MLERKTIPGGLCVEDGEGFPAIARIDVDMDNFQALELLHATDPLADEADLGCTLAPVVDRGVEDIRKHPPIRGVRASIPDGDQGELVVRGPLREGIGERRVEL